MRMSKSFFSGRKRLTHAKENECLADSLKFNPEDELSITDLSIDTQSILGMGNFGTVYKGVAKGKPAAIKAPNKDCPKAAFKSILSEVKVLCYIGVHKNVVEFLGAYTKDIRKGLLYIATELCSNGSLESFLRTKTTLVSQHLATLSAEDGSIEIYDLHRFSMEIACGMEYISGLNVVHGDLAARNVFLNDNYTCKIGDFGLSRKLYEYQVYVKKSQEAIPWKWMAYESLTKMEFTFKSDMWSYCVVLWEIYSLGFVPYGGLNWTKEFAKNLRDGLRLEKPEFASDEIFSKMLQGWTIDPDARPTFLEMIDFFKPLCYSEYAVLETSL